MTIKLTNIWKINNTLVVANSIEEASNWLRTILMDNHDEFGYRIVSSVNFANMDEFINRFKEDIR